MGRLSLVFPQSSLASLAHLADSGPSRQFFDLSSSKRQFMQFSSKLSTTGPVMFQNRTVVSLDDEAIVNGRFGWEESPYTSAKCECVDVLPTKLELEL